MTLDEVRLLTAKRLAAVDPVNQPFPHAFIRDVFPEPFYRALRANLPPEEALVPSDRIQSGNPYGAHRKQFPIDPPHLDAMDADRQAFWRPVYKWLRSGEFVTQVVSRFAPGIQARFGSQPLDLISRIEVNIDGESYAIRPHTDNPRKMLTMLFYLPEDDSRADLGTSIYAPKKAGYVSEQTMQHEFEEFDEVERFPYIPNSCLAFLKTANSFHGRPTITGPAVRRPMLFIMIQHRREMPQVR
ncbi:hypothetical protein EDC65_3581 [Stella humosa]|uniref:2-oxoglutarate-Fe(II)-dependent oxygenase superfamily protein n=1 Tax=Stella humosa TaxID=94 RepID=A0A3N1KQZ0_9PROT|nr:hypothetical protein [Stella humosa]ROP84233.1 hypothetical protein EDC65_3581 [Stella humosa]BBK33745.1 hypothetical protein STHU_43790 [Stella humosa]